MPLMAASARRPPLRLHAVELDWRQAENCDQRHLCIRFYDDGVREVGSCLITVSDDGTIEDVLTEAKSHLQIKWGIKGPLRCLEVADGRLHQRYGREALVRQLLCFGRANILFHCLRVEAEEEVPTGHNLVEVFHCDRQSVQAFGQPFMLSVLPGEKSGSLKARCKAKLRVPDGEFKSWRLVRVGRGSRLHLKDDDPWDLDAAPDARLCLEHVSTGSTNSALRHSRYNKPLTIK